MQYSSSFKKSKRLCSLSNPIMGPKEEKAPLASSSMTQMNVFEVSALESIKERMSIGVSLLSTYTCSIDSGLVQPVECLFYPSLKPSLPIPKQYVDSVLLRQREWSLFFFNYMDSFYKDSK